MPAHFGARAALMAAVPAAAIGLDLDLTSTAGGLTCTRSTAATVIDASGAMTAVAANTLKRSSLGLFVEPAWTELLYATEYFNGTWQGINGATLTQDTSPASNLGVSPRGDQTAALWAFSSSQTSGAYFNVAMAAGNYVMTGFFKASTGAPVLQLGLGSAYSQINVSTLAITNTGGAVGIVTALANGWYRFVIVMTSVPASQKPTIYALAGSNNACYIWGVNLVAGAAALSYVQQAANNATLAASADTVTLPQSGIGRVVLTFDDASQQTITGIPTGTPYALVPANLNRPLIKRLQGFAA